MKNEPSPDLQLFINESGDHRLDFVKTNKKNISRLAKNGYVRQSAAGHDMCPSVVLASLKSQNRFKATILL